MATQVNSPQSTFNSVSGNQTNYNYHFNARETDLAARSSNKLPSQPPFNDAPIGLLSVHFTGRQKELARIEKAFDRLRGNVPLRCVLYGNQGVGKSQLTYEWARSTFDRGTNSYILWVSSTTLEKLDQGFSKLLHLVHHPDRSHPEQAVRLMAARRWLEEVALGNWLLVLDNVFPETVGFLREHLPRKNGRGSILFTTRTRNVAIALASATGRQDELIEVPMLDTKDGVELFLGHFDAGEIVAPLIKVEDIVKSVGCLPLAISHATAFMKQSGSSFDDMLALYQSQDKIRAISWENTLSDYEHKSVAATFECQVEDLQRQFPQASNLLKVLAYFDPENISLDMLITGAEAWLSQQQSPSSHPPSVTKYKRTSFLHKIKDKVLHRGDDKGKGQTEIPNTTQTTPSDVTALLTLIQSPIELRESLAHLHNRSLVASQEGSQLRIHDLIQLVVLENTKKHCADLQWFEFAVQLVCNVFKKIENYKSPGCWPQCEALVPHIQSLTTRWDISRKAKEQLIEANHNHARYLRSRGRFGEAEKVYLQILSAREQLFGSEDQQTLAVMYSLGGLYRSQGRYSDAEELLKQVLRKREHQLGPEHVSTLATMHRLAYVHVSQERYDEAEALIIPVLREREKQVGSENINTLKAKYILALVHHAKGRHSEAEALLEQVLKSERTLLGLGHHDTLPTMHELARVYDSQGRYGDAEGLYKQVLHGQEKLLGSDHPSTLATKHSLGIVYESQRQYKEAEDLFVHVFARQQEVLGLSHPHTQKTMDQLTSLYEKLGRFDDAEELRRCAEDPC